MLRSIRSIVVIAVAFFCPVVACTAQGTLAFPGAEEYGRFARGGRVGDVIHVTHFNDSGPGSIRQGIEPAKRPRTIVFDVSGNIRLKSPLQIREKDPIPPLWKSILTVYVPCPQSN